MTTIICDNCGESKERYSNNICKKCYMKDYNKKYYQNNKKRIKVQTKKYYFNNLEKCRQKRREYMKQKSRKEYLKNYYYDNIDYLTTKNKENYEKNKDRYLQSQYNYKKKRLNDDYNFYLKDRLSTRIRMIILNHKGSKKSKSLELLGADIDTVRIHIESQFKPGMSWENHGEWHIDHIRPCDDFDLTDVEEQKKCFHYTNLQPLWSSDNIKKSNKIKKFK